MTNEIMVDELHDKIDQLRVQLAGCGVAALGYATGKNDCKKGDYGWSQSFQDVKDLWDKYVKLLKIKPTSREKLKSIIKDTLKHYEVSERITSILADAILAEWEKGIKMENEQILKNLNIFVCECGVLIQLDKIKNYQYNPDLRKQRVYCPVCKNEIWREE